MTAAEVVAWADAIGHVCAGTLGLVGFAGVLVIWGWMLVRMVQMSRGAE